MTRRVVIKVIYVFVAVLLLSVALIATPTNYLNSIYQKILLGEQAFAPERLEFIQVEVGQKIGNIDLLSYSEAHSYLSDLREVFEYLQEQYNGNANLHKKLEINIVDKILERPSLELLSKQSEIFYVADVSGEKLFQNVGSQIISSVFFDIWEQFRNSSSAEDQNNFFSQAQQFGQLYSLSEQGIFRLISPDSNFSNLIISEQEVLLLLQPQQYSSYSIVGTPLSLKEGIQTQYVTLNKLEDSKFEFVQHRAFVDGYDSENLFLSVAFKEGTSPIRLVTLIPVLFNKNTGTQIPPKQEICNNAIDDNEDGWIDCNDQACIGVLPYCPGYPAENCSNGVDDDYDYQIDCADGDCNSSELCQIVIIPTEIPTEVPTEYPTEVPTEYPTVIPTEIWTEIPTEIPTEVPTEIPTEIPTQPADTRCDSCALTIKVEGHDSVVVPCEVGDWSCQAHYVCNAITNSECVWQQYDCATGNSGSWYPPDGASGNADFNFAYTYDLQWESYGNICACNRAQMDRYGLASDRTFCGLGVWYRDGVGVEQTTPIPVVTQTRTATATNTASQTPTSIPSATNTNLPPTAIPVTLATATASPTPSRTASPTALAAVCGNGQKEAGEACDDGNSRVQDGCNASCQLERCDGCALNIPVEGRGNVIVPCEIGDWSCQAHYVCNAITNSECIWQEYDCATHASGSWYPQDGQSGGDKFSFAYAYDLHGGNFGNICACNYDQMNKYGLASSHQSCGLGLWYRDGQPPTPTPTPVVEESPTPMPTPTETPIDSTTSIPPDPTPVSTEVPIETPIEPTATSIPEISPTPSLCGNGEVDPSEECDTSASAGGCYNGSSYYCQDCRCHRDPCGDGYVDAERGEECEPDLGPDQCQAGECSSCKCVVPKPRCFVCVYDAVDPAMKTVCDLSAKEAAKKGYTKQYLVNVAHLLEDEGQETLADLCNCSPDLLAESNVHGAPGQESQGFLYYDALVNYAPQCVHGDVKIKMNNCSYATSTQRMLRYSKNLAEQMASKGQVGSVTITGNQSVSLLPSAQFNLFKTGSLGMKIKLLFSKGAINNIIKERRNRCFRDDTNYPFGVSVCAGEWGSILDPCKQAGDRVIVDNRPPANSAVTEFVCQLNGERANQSCSIGEKVYPNDKNSTVYWCTMAAPSVCN